MLRCKICDWAPGAPKSDYFIGLSLSHYPRKIVEDSHGDFVCDSCRDSPYDDDDELIDPNEDQENE